MATRAPLDVFRYVDYREFLRAYYARKRAQKPGISLRAFSRRAGLKSPNHLKLVIDGDRNLFAIYDELTGQVLFLGRVMDPSGG